MATASTEAEEEATAALIIENKSSGKKSKSRRHDSSDSDRLESEKKKKKSKKEHRHKEHRKNKEIKDHKEKNNEHDIPTSSSTTSIEKINSESQNETSSIIPASTSVNKVDFFANLLAMEKNKMTGSVHTLGKKEVEEKKTGVWICRKCSTSNLNNSHQCHKCHILKKMTEYR